MVCIIMGIVVTTSADTDKLVWDMTKQPLRRGGLCIQVVTRITN